MKRDILMSPNNQSQKEKNKNRGIMLSNKSLLAALFVAAVATVNAQNPFVNTAKIGGGPDGSMTYNGPGSFTVYGGGNDIWDTQDEFTFHYYQVTGDFDVRVRIDYVQPAARWTKAGLMVRETLNPDSRMAFSKVTPSDPLSDNCGNSVGAGDVSLMYRTWLTDAGSNGGQHEDRIVTPDPGYPSYKWVRLQRIGSVIYGYASQDGVNWVGPVARDTSSWSGGALTNTLLLGLAVSRHGCAPINQARAEFRNFGDADGPVVITQSPTNTTGLVDYTVTFSVEVGGGYDFVTFQWLKDGVEIPGATSRTYTTPALTAADNGSRYSVRVTNTRNNSTAVSDEAVLTVKNTPVLLGATVNDNPNKIVLNFSKNISQSTAQNLQNYTVSGLNITAAAFGQDAKQIVLTVSPAMTYQSQYQITVRDLQSADTGDPIDPNPSVTTVTFGQNYTAARIIRNYYRNTGGNRVSYLYANPKFPFNPDVVDYPPYFEDDRGNSEDYVGGKIYGWFVPPVTGNYQFFTAGDDENIVFLSTDADPLNKRQIATQTDWGNFRDYFDNTSQNSSPIPLIAGKKYYLEVLWTDGTGGGHCSVAVQTPGGPAIVGGSLPIAANMFAPAFFIAPNGQTFTNFGPIVIYRQPSSVTVLEGNSATFKIDLDGSAPYTISWYTNNVLVEGQSGKTLTIPYVDFTMDGTSVKAVVQNSFSSATSLSATLNVLFDDQPPQPVSAVADTSFTTVTLRFNEPVTEATLGDAVNYYIISVADQTPLDIIGATIVDSQTVRIQTAQQTPGVQYEIQIDGIEDRAPAHNVLYGGSIKFTAWVMSRGFIRFETYDAGGGNAVETTENYVNAGNPPREVFYISSFNSREAYPDDSHEYYGGRFVGYLIPPITAEYMIYSHADDGHKVYFNPNGADPAGKLQITYYSPGCCTAMGGDPSEVYGPVTLQAGTPYYIEGLYKEGTGGDWMEVGAKLAADPTPPSSVPPIARQYLAAYANPDQAGEITITTQPENVSTYVNQFASFTVEATSSKNFNIFYQWQKSTDGGNTWVDILGANGKKLSLGPLTLDDNGTLLRAQMHVPGKIATSATVTLTVTEDTEPPNLVSAFGGDTTLVLVFSELMEEASTTDPFSYQIFDEDGNYLDITASTYQGSQVVLTTSPQIAGKRYTVTADQNALIDLAGNPLNQNEVTFYSWLGYKPGQIKRMFYNNLSGANNFMMFTNSSNFPYNPDLVDYFDQMAVNPALGNSGTEYYGTRLVGFIIPPETGLYRFQVYADDSGWLRLNTNSANSTDPTQLTDVIYAPGDCGACGAPISAESYRLEAGKMYAIEALFQEGTGGDYLIVRWALPSNPASFVTISGTNIAAGLDPNVVTLSIVQQPQSASVAQTRQVTFSIAVQSSPPDYPISYQWQVSTDNGATWQDIENATGKSYTTPNVSLADDGKQFRVIARMTGIEPMVREVISDVAVLTVVPDNIPPTVISANAFSNFVGIQFSERMDATTATNPANYSINGGAVQIASIELRPNETQVKLLLAQNISGQYTVDISGLTDLVGNQLEATQLTGTVSDLMFIDIGGPQPPGYLFSGKDGDFDVMAGGNDVWDGVNQFSYIYKPITGDFDVKVRVQRLDFVGNNWSKAGINVRESVNEQAGMFWTYPTPATGSGYYEGGLRQYTGAGIYDFGQPRPPVTFPNCWVRVKREGQIFTAYTSTNGYNWNVLGSSQTMSQMPQTMLVGLGTVSHIQGTATYAEFRDFGPTLYPDAVITITQQPASIAVAQGATATFTVNATVENAPANEISYKWQVNTGAGFTDIPDARGNTLSVVGSTSNNGYQYRAVAYVPGVSVVSQPAVLAVNVDTIPPVPVSAIRALSKVSVRIDFNEALDQTSATKVENYSINNGVIVTGVTLSGDGKTVVLDTTQILDGYDYLVTINNVKDLAGNSVLPNTQVPLVMLGNKTATGSPLMLVIEAENYDRTSPDTQGARWQFQNSQSGYSGTGYMISLPNSGRTVGDYDFNSPRLAYDVYLPAAGRWYVWLRATSAGGEDNSAHVGIDGNRTANTTIAGNAGIWSTLGSWAWENKRNNGGELMYFDVPSEGIHTLTIWMREDGLMLDKIILYNSLDNPPGISRGSTASGPSETPLPTGYGTLHIVQQPQTATVLPGQTAIFTVVAQSDKPLSYQWKKDGVNIDGATSSTLTIQNAQVADAGAYTVVVSDGVNPDVTSAIAYLIVGQAPVIVQQPQSQTVLKGSTVNLTVVASGVGLTYQWSKDNSPIPGAIGSVLTLRNVSSADVGTYTVTVQNQVGSVTSDGAQLTVNNQPEIITPLASQVADVGSTVTFIVQATGDPVLTYVWKKNGTVIEGADQPQLTLNDVQESDQATYTVEVSNQYGTASSSAPLVVNQAPVAGDITVTTAEDVPVAIQLPVSDPDNDPIGAVNIVTPPANGTLSYLTTYTWSSDFNSSQIQGASLYGAATILPTGGVNNSGVLRLTPNVNGQGGSFVMNEFVPGTIIKGFTATFKVHLGEGSGNPADGFSFNFANDLVNTEWPPEAAEQGVGSGLRVCFQFYNQDRIVIKRGQTQLAYIPTVLYGFAGFVDCSVTLAPNGKVTVFWNGQPIVQDLDSGVVPSNGYRFGFYARTGGENANQMIDNLTITAQLDQTKIFYTPNANFNGQDQFTYTVTDGRLTSQAGTVTINVLPVNDPPIAEDMTVNGLEDQPLPIQLQLVDVDQANEPMTYIVLDGPQNGALTGGTTQDTFNFSYSADFNVGNTVPGATLYGTAQILPAGGVNNSGVLKLTRNLNGEAGSMIINEFAPGATVKRFTATFKMHLGEGSGNPADGFSFNFGPDLVDAASAPEAAENGVGSGLRVCFKIYGDDRIQIRQGQNTLVDFPTQVYGLPGYVECTINFDEDGTVDVVWNGITIAQDLQTGLVPAPGYRFGIYARTGGENANQWLDDLQINAVLYKPGMLVSSSPNLTYTPNPDWNGSDGFTYIIYDGSLFSQVANVDIEIENVYDAPRLGTVNSTTIEDAETAIQINLIGSAVSVDGLPLTYGLPSATSMRGGNVSIVNGVITYTPAPNFNGVDTIQYTVNDGVSVVTGTVQVVVAPINDVRPYTFNQAVNYQTGGTNPIAVAVADYKKDTKLDIAVVNQGEQGQGGNVAMLIGDGKGNFALDTNNLPVAVAGTPIAAVSGDFNKDLTIDIAVLTAEGQVVVLYGNNGGTFSSSNVVAVGGSPTSLTAADFDKDLRLDLAVGDASGVVKILLNKASGWIIGADVTVGGVVSAVGAGDLFKTLKQGLVVADSVGNKVWLIPGDGKGGFSNAVAVAYDVGESPVAVAVGDVNNDKLLDVVVVNGGSDDITVLTNKGKGVMEAAGTFGVGESIGAMARGVVLGDF
ncbi:MAG: immunoglobulin domain-containing protein, partial [Verrucomicrobiia bacterium]